MLKKFIIILLALSVSFPGAARRTIFVSSSKGNDSNSGLSTEAPVRTLARARELGDDIRLRGGDTFYESTHRKKGFNYRPYYDGQKARPVISGFRIIPAGMSTSLWQQGCFNESGEWMPSAEGNIYRLDLEAEGFEGYLGNTSSKSGNIGTLYDPEKDILYGRKCQFQSKEIYDRTEGFKTNSPYKYMYKDMDSFQPSDDFRYLYVLCNDRSKLIGKELWLSMGDFAVRGTDFTLTGLSIIGWGRHGCRADSRVTVKDCEFDIIGGSILESYPYWIRFGNGAEVWAKSAVDVIVERCTFSRVFDTATTIQGNMPESEGSFCTNIHFRHNVMRNCRQDFEVWINNPEGLQPSDCSFTHNKGYDCGYNGFETGEYNNSHLLYYFQQDSSPLEGFRIEKNSFYGGMALYYANTNIRYLKIGRNKYFCSLGAPVLHAYYGQLEINAPVLENGQYRYAVDLDEEGRIIYALTGSRTAAVKGVEVLVNRLTGADFRLVVR